MLLATEASDENFIDIDVPVWAWVVLGVCVVVLLGLDLWRHRHAHAPTFREAGIESIFWVVCSLIFGVFMFVQFGGTAGGEYLGVYITEKSLSVDNVFVWALLFSTMKIPLKYQHRVLFWGIFGALTLRAIFILLGSALVERFVGVLVFFGLFLVWTGIRIIRHREDEGENTSTAGLGLLKRFMPVTEELDGQKFFTMVNGRRAATPLFAALVVVEFTDVVFAVDSVPASFGVANDPYILIAANAFAIMGLRAMYFLLADARERFHYLSHALGAILLFVGIKLILTPWTHIDIGISLGIIGVILVLAVIFSIWKAKQVELAAEKAESSRHPE
ncbi:MAG: TerC/Alx family metal homeostasis membrane protein [Acidimicrobiia bacterium]|nr:TerC/Alx family metal homeostasis membrane protein [Acidimicrobiia bacterium]